MNYSEYVGIPFVDAGRTKDGCDCWGLVRLVLQEQFCKTLPAFDDYERATHDVSERIVETGRLELPIVKIDDPQEGDIALYRLNDGRWHVALYIGNGEILHTNRGTDSVIEKTDCPRLYKKLEGYYHVS